MVMMVIIAVKVMKQCQQIAHLHYTWYNIIECQISCNVGRKILACKLFDYILRCVDCSLVMAVRGQTGCNLYQFIFDAMDSLKLVILCNDVVALTNDQSQPQITIISLDAWILVFLRIISISCTSSLYICNLKRRNIYTINPAGDNGV